MKERHRQEGGVGELVAAMVEAYRKTGDKFSPELYKNLDPIVGWISLSGLDVLVEEVETYGRDVLANNRETAKLYFGLANVLRRYGGRSGS